MDIISRGIRNAFRNSIRTFSIVVILGLSIGLALTMLVAGEAVNSKIASVKGSIGNIITISPAGARGFDGGGNFLTTTELDKVKSLPHVVAVNEMLQDRLTSTDTNLQSSITAGSIGRRFGGGGRFGGGSGTSGSTATFTPPVIVTGTTSPTQTSGFGGGTLTIKSGKAFESASSANVAMVGSDLAIKNSLLVGSTFTAYNTTITVVAIFDAGNTFANSGLVMPLATIQTLSAQPGDVSSATVQADSISNLSTTVTSIQNSIGTSVADVVSQQDTSNQALAPLETIKSISFISLIGAVVAGAVIILLTMLMIVRERRREIGVLKAIGSSNVKIVTQFVTESITFTVIGAAVGLVIGVLASSPVTNILISSSSSAGGQTAVGGHGFGGGVARVFGQGGNAIRNIHAVVGWDILLYGLGAAILIAIIGTAAPAFFISKVRPAEVMRVE